ncbi:hypothetical protein HG537_0E01200 [Torulaspora globosa]|uniref:Uncharacterized protein n=1 Tax=Torulaspora globosa TaxID=48254 RepID=A0A7H9HWC2_9SACH|nr:hypothetical protein HG537_0E01200 [Torulaspora sp. CBS 2947]
MGSYLLRRRLRHVRSIGLCNVSVAVESKSDKMVVPFAGCFVALESLKGEVLYVSEVQCGFINNVQFNEFPKLEYSVCHVVLKVMVKIPEESGLKRVMKRDDWLVLREFEVDLDRLQSIDREDQLEGENVPLFEMNDGVYTLREQCVVRNMVNEDLYLRHRRNGSRNQVQESFSFNSALKLSIMVNYKAQVLREIEETSRKIDNAIEFTGEHSQIVCLERYLADLRQSFIAKKSYLRQLHEELESSIDLYEKSSSPSADGQSLQEYYGNNYPNLIKIKDRVDCLKLKKLSRLISIFQATCLFQKEIGFIEYENACMAGAPYERTRLKLVDQERVLAIALKSEAERNIINTCLGYYLLFIQLTATTVFQIALPYGMKFNGSTSMVGNDCLYINDNSSAKRSEAQLRAIDCFNKNLIQVIQRWEHHVLTRAGDQMSRMESH